MVRETRHLWVGNLPENIREDRIIDHFKRYGKVQSVRILPKSSSEGNGIGLGPNCSINGTMLCNGVCATVAFIDIKSAAKAHKCENKIEERTLKTDYYEPHSYHHHDDHLPPSKSIHLNVAPVTNASATSISSSSSVSSTSAAVAAAASSSSSTIAAASSTSSSAASPSSIPTPSSSTSTASANVTTSSTASSSTVSAVVAVSSSSASSSSSSSTSPATSLPSNASLYGRHTPSSRVNEERSYDPRDRSCNSNHVDIRDNNSYLQKRSSNSYHDENESPSFPRNRSSREPSVIGRTSFCATSSSTGSRNVTSSTGVNYSDESYTANSAVESTNNAASSSHHVSYQNLPGAFSTQDNMSSSLLNDREEMKAGICVKNFPVRSTDSNIKDGLYHEFKKYGRITSVRVSGQSNDRYALVFFKKREEAERALSDSKDKQFFGVRIDVSSYDNNHVDIEENDNFKLRDSELDEYHPLATRTLFVGNLDKDVTTADLSNKFSQFGKILEIDIKKQNQPFAFIQFIDILSVVRAMRKCDNECMGNNKLKLGFGKSFSTSCVWLYDTVESFSDEKSVLNQMKRYGTIKSHVYVLDNKGSALIYYESPEAARLAVEDLKNKYINGRKIQVDFASRDFQAYFFEKHVKPDDTHRNSGSVNSWSGNSLDYEDRIYENSRNRNMSYHHHQVTSRSTSISSQFRSNNISGLNSSYSSRQRSQSPTSSPANLNSSFSFSRNSVCSSNSSSLHGSGRIGKYEYHHDSNRLPSRQPYRYDVDDEDLGDDSHLSSSSKRESRYRSHHISDNYLNDSSPKLRRDSSPFCSYGNSLKLDSEFHRSNRNEDILKSHDDTHSSVRRGNHSKNYHKSGRDSPHSSQFRKSGLTSSSSSTSSCSRSPVRDFKSSSHYPDRASLSPSASPRTNSHSYHENDRLNDSSVTDSSKLDKEYNSSAQWRRKSTEDSMYHRDHANADSQRVRSESISESGESNFSTQNSHRDHSRDYNRDRFRESHSSRSNSTVSPSSLTYQNRSDSQIKRKFVSTADSDDSSFTDISGHLERKKRLLACIEQSPALSTTNTNTTTSVTTTTTSKSNCLDQRVTSSKSVDSIEMLNGSKLKCKEVFSSSVDGALKRRSSSSSSSSSIVNNLTTAGGNGTNISTPINDLKSNAKSSDMINLIEQLFNSSDESVAMLNLFQNNPDSSSLQQFVRNKQQSQSSTSSSIVNQSTTKPKSCASKEPFSTGLRVVDCSDPTVNSKLNDPRLSGHGVRKSSNRTSCDNDLNIQKSSDASSFGLKVHQYGPNSPMSLPLPDFWFNSSRTSSISTDSRPLTTSSVASTSTTSVTSTTTVTTMTTTTPSLSLTHINIPNFTTSPKSINIMSPLGNLSPVPKSRISRDRMSTETNCFEIKKPSNDLDDVSDSDISPLRTSLDDRLKDLDEKYNAWSGTATISKSEKTPTIDYSKYNIKKKSQSISSNTNNSLTTNTSENESTDMIKSLLSKSSVFDGDSKRLERIFDAKSDSKESSLLETDNLLCSPKAKSTLVLPRNKLSSSGSSSLAGSTQVISNSLVLPTEKSLDPLPKNTLISTTSVSSTLLTSASSHLSHHPHPITSSSHSTNTIPTSSNSILRKFSDQSRVKKDSLLGSTSTPTTPSSAPARPISSVFPQFARSSSNPSTTTPTTPNPFSRSSSTIQPKKEIPLSNTSLQKSDRTKPDFPLLKPNSLSNSIQSKDTKTNVTVSPCVANKPTTPKVKDNPNKHILSKQDYFKNKYESNRGESINRKNSDSSLEQSTSNNDNENPIKEHMKSRNDTSKHSISKDQLKDEIKEQKKYDKVEKLKEKSNDFSVNNHNSLISVKDKEKKSEKCLLKMKKKNKEKFKDKESTKEQCKQKSKFYEKQDKRFEGKERFRKIEKKRDKHKDKRDGKRNKSDMDFEAPTYFLSMYDKVKARSSANQNLKVANNCSKMSQSKEKRHSKHDKSSQDSESDSDDSSDEKMHKQKKFRKRKAVIDSSDLSSDEEVTVKRSRIYSNDSDSDKVENEKFSNQNSIKKEPIFKWNDDDDDDCDENVFSEGKLKSLTKDIYSRKVLEIHNSTDDEHEFKDKMTIKKKKKKKDREMNSYNKNEIKNDSIKSEKLSDNFKELQKLKMKNRKEFEKRIKIEDEDHKVIKLSKKKRKKPKLSKEKRHSFTKDEREVKNIHEMNKINRIDMSSGIDSDISDSFDGENVKKARLFDSDSENESRNHIQCYSKDGDSRLSESSQYSNKKDSITKVNSLEKCEKTSKNLHKLESPTKKSNEMSFSKKQSKENKPFSSKLDDDDSCKEVKKKRKKNKDKEKTRKDSESSDSKISDKKEFSYCDNVPFKLSSTSPKSISCDLRLSPDTLETVDTMQLALPKTPEILRSRSPSYTEELIEHHEDGSSSDSKIDEELIRLGDRVECMIANNDDSLSDSNLSRSSSPLNSSKPLHTTGLCNLLQPSLTKLVTNHLPENNIDQNITNFHTPQRSFEDEAAIQSLKLQKELETLDTKTPDIHLKTTFETPTFTTFVSNIKKSPLEESTFKTIVTPEKVDKRQIYPSIEIEAKAEDQVKQVEFNSEIDSQRKIEDALAVAALLQDMNVPCAHQVSAGNNSPTIEDSATDDTNAEFIISNEIVSNDIEAVASLEPTVSNTVVPEVDEQELKAAVQEIELVTQEPEIEPKPKHSSTNDVSIVNEDMFNDEDEDDIEPSLMIDESVIDKSLQDDSCEVLEFVDTSSSQKQTIVSSISSETFTFEPVVSNVPNVPPSTSDVSTHDIDSSPTIIESLEEIKDVPTTHANLTFVSEAEKQTHIASSGINLETKPFIHVETPETIFEVEETSSYVSKLTDTSFSPKAINTENVEIFIDSSVSDDQKCSPDQLICDKTENEERVSSELFEEEFKLSNNDKAVVHHDEVFLNNELKEIQNKRNVEESEAECESVVKPGRRGRRAKNRKNSDSSMHSPRSEHSGCEQMSCASALSINTNLSSGPNALLSPSSLSPNTSNASTFSDVSPGSNVKRVKQSPFTCFTRRSVRTAAVVATVANTNTVLEELEENDFSHDDQPTNNEHEDEHGVKKPSKRGRKKKNSGNSETAAKVSDDVCKRDRHSLTLNAPSNEVRPKPSNSPYDIFEFRDSDEDEPINLDSIKSSTHFMSSSVPEEKRHSESTTEVSANLPSKQPDVPVASNSSITPVPDAHNFTVNIPNTNTSGKEYVSEVSQNKIGITIRLQSKDGQEGPILTEPVKSKSANTEDSKSNDGTCALNLSPSSQLTNSSNNKAVRKSARLMSQLPKTTIEDTIEDVIKTHNNKTESDKSSYKRITRSFRKSDDSQQQSTQDSQDEQEDSKNLRSYRITRSRGAVSTDLSDVNSDTPRTNSNVPSNSALKQEDTEEENSCQPNLPPVEEAASTETPISNEVEEPTDSSLDVKPVVSIETFVPETSPASVIHSTGNVDKLPTNITSQTTSTIASVITSLPPTIYPTPTVIASPDYLQDIPNLSERIHHSSTALKLKTGKGLIFEDFKAPIFIHSTADPSTSSSTPSVITHPTIDNSTKVVSESCTTPSSTASSTTSITIKPKHQPPVGQPLTQAEILDVSSSNTTNVPISPLSNTAKITSYPSTVTTPNDTVEETPPPAHLPKLNRTSSPSVVDSMKVLNMTTVAEKNPSTVTQSPMNKALHTKPVQVAGSPQPTHDVQHAPYPTSILPAHSHLSENYLSALQKQQGLPTQLVPTNRVPKLQDSDFEASVSHIPNEYQSNSSPSIIPQHYPALSHVRPQSNDTFNVMPNVYMAPYSAAIRPSNLGMALPPRYVYPPGFPSQKMTENLVASEQQKQLQHHSKPSKEELHNQQISEEHRLHGAPDLSFQMPPPQRSVAYTPNNLRHYSSFLQGHERFPNEALINYGFNGQARNLPLPTHGFSSSTATDLSKHISNESVNPDSKRSPSIKPTIQDSVYLPQLHRQLPSQRAPSPAYLKDLPLTEPSQDLIRAQLNAVASQYGHPKDISLAASNLPLNMSAHSQRPPSRPASAVHPLNRSESLNDQHAPRSQHPYIGSEPSYVSSSPVHTITSPNTNQETSQQSLLEKYPLTWQGLLSLKNDQACIQMHYVSGSREIAYRALSTYNDPSSTPLRITQRMRIEPTQLQGLERKIQSHGEYCILMALPCGRDNLDVLKQNGYLKNNFINYLQSKLAAGIVNTNDATTSYIIHIFPSCEFSEEHLIRVVPDFMPILEGFSHLMVVITPQ